VVLCVFGLFFSFVLGGVKQFGMNEGKIIAGGFFLYFVFVIFSGPGKLPGNQLSR